MDCKDKESPEKVFTPSTTLPINSNFGAGCCFAAGFLSFVTIGFVISSMSPIIPILHHMYNATHMNRYGEPISEDKWTLYLTLTLSFLIVGAAVGGLTVKYWLMIFSRKHLLQLCHAINIISVLLMALVGALTWSWEVMMVARFVMGFPVGAYHNLIPIMIAEMSARSKQDIWQSMAGVGACLGSLLGAVFAHPKVLGTMRLWPMLISLGAFPSLVYLIWSLWIPDTPFHILRRSGRDEALQVLKKLRTGDENCSKEISEMQREMNEKPVIGIKEIITTKQYRNQQIAVIALYANCMLVGINNISLYADYVLRQAGMSSESSGSATIGIFALQVVAGLFGSFFINRFGGLKVNIASNVFAIVAHTLFTISQATMHLAPNVMPFIAVVAIGIFMVGWSGGNNLATFVLLGQLTIEPIRPTAFLYGNIFMWISAWFVGFIPPYLKIHLGPYSFTIWLGCALFFLIYQVIFLPDPKGKTVDEIQSEFK